MSAAALPTQVAERGADTRTGLGRLTLVELRKMTDTRAGFWLLLSTAVLTVGAAVMACLVFPGEERILLNFLVLAVQPASILMPIVGILLVSSEWSQRTAMITFTLVPDRSRVLVAKLLAGLVLATIAFLLCLLVALLATTIAGVDGDAAWSLPTGLIGQVAFSVAVPMLVGIGFGAALLASAPAIVLYFVLPTAWTGLGAISVLEGAASWLDMSRTMAPMLDETLSAAQWARVATSLALWMVLPIALGLWRIARSDVR
ncbi:MAG: ABC transporter permease subunit [Solirubrobacteraceae bacterium]|nr:ABC transporter permease subunit [Solirubrobacteraceae bacterium]